MTCCDDFQVRIRRPAEAVGPTGGISNGNLRVLRRTERNCAENSNPGGGLPLQYFGFNCTGSEMGHVFYNEFGATAGQSILAGSNAANLALFNNVRSGGYWSGTEYAPVAGGAWNFYTGIGFQYNVDKVNALYAVAVGLWPDAACKARPPTAPFFWVSQMARHEHLPIYKAALDMMVHFEGLVAGFSRYHKYTLGTELRQGSCLVLQQVLRANNAATREQRAAELLELHLSLTSARA